MPNALLFVALCLPLKQCDVWNHPYLLFRRELRNVAVLGKEPYDLL
jgi:hypothetical protein